ncbi:hypothetical protein HKD37_13G038483 [Glycine soja]
MPLPAERTYRYVDTSRSPTAIISVEQFLRATPGGESCRKSPTYSPTSSSPSSPYFEKLKNQDPEEDHGLYQKKSVLTKVKERARKFRYSLSKRRMDDENVTPSWGVSLEEDEEEDPEYLGAPMYESELAPEEYKEYARQHPRANPVISEKHVLHNAVKLGAEQDQQKSRGAVSARFTTTTPNMTSETTAQKLTPVYVGVSNAANAISSKIQAVSSSTTAPAANDMSSHTSSLPSSSMQNSSSASLSGKNTSCQKSASLRDNLMNQCEQGDRARNVPTMQKSSSLSASMTENKNITSLMSASVKDYSMNKSEPRDDAKTVSQPQVMISEATSPKRTSSNAGVMDKVRGAVNSLLGNEEPSQQYGVKTPTTRTSSQQTQQVDQEENRRRILQEN